MFDDLWCCDQVCDGLLQQEAPLHPPGLLPQKNNTVQVHGFLQIIVPLHLSTKPSDVISQENIQQHSTTQGFLFITIPVRVVTQPPTLQTLFLRRKHDSTVNRNKVNFICSSASLLPPSLFSQKDNTVQVRRFLYILLPLLLSTQPTDVVSKEKHTYEYVQHKGFF